MALNKFNLPWNPNDYSSKAKIDKELNQALLLNENIYYEVLPGILGICLKKAFNISFLGHVIYCNLSRFFAA